MRFFLLFLLCWNVWAQGPQFPDLRRPVIDQAGLLSVSDAEALASLARSLHAQGGPMVGIFIADQLQDYPIEEFSIRLAEAWRLGDQQKDEGLVVVIAPRERKMRIEVGGGIEGEITDQFSSRLIRDVLRPAFREGAYAQGLAQLLNEVGTRFNVQLSKKPLVKRSRQRVDFPTLIFFLILVGMGFVSPFLRAARGTGFRSYGGRSGWGGGYGGGGWSGGSGGGSSWGGGGGGFSGGGASGDW